MQDKIYIKGARENNLKNVDVEIPRDKLVVVTGLSGSGKSSLAFDTVAVEKPIIWLMVRIFAFMGLSLPFRVQGYIKTILEIFRLS